MLDIKMQMIKNCLSFPQMFFVFTNLSRNHSEPLKILPATNIFVNKTTSRDDKKCPQQTSWECQRLYIVSAYKDGFIRMRERDRLNGIAYNFSQSIKIENLITGVTVPPPRPLKKKNMQKNPLVIMGKFLVVV